MFLNCSAVVEAIIQLSWHGLNVEQNIIQMYKTTCMF